jgi:hypothetical protein
LSHQFSVDENRYSILDSRAVLLLESSFPGDRASWLELHGQIVEVGSNSALQGSIYDFPGCVLVVNGHRQIVYANAASQQMLCGDADPATLYGCRPGEAIGCIQANKGDGGCGTSKICRFCGARKAVFAGLAGLVDVQRCQLKIEGSVSVFKGVVISVPVCIKDRSYALVLIETSDAEESTSAIAKQVFLMQKMAGEISEGVL